MVVNTGEDNGGAMEGTADRSFLDDPILPSPSSLQGGEGGDVIVLEEGEICP